jgi:hypothetical protein
MICYVTDVSAEAVSWVSIVHVTGAIGESLPPYTPEDILLQLSAVYLVRQFARGCNPFALACLIVLRLPSRRRAVVGRHLASPRNLTVWLTRSR